MKDKRKTFFRKFFPQRNFDFIVAILSVASARALELILFALSRFFDSFVDQLISLFSFRKFFTIQQDARALLIINDVFVREYIFCIFLNN